MTAHTRKPACVIFGGAPVNPEKQPPVPEADYYFCADAGVKLAKALGIVPDWVVGDFDSLGNVPEGENVAVYPAEKDDTDTGIAVKRALSLGCRVIYVYGGLGGRLDHTMANLQLLRLVTESGAEGILLDEAHLVTMQSEGTRRYSKGDYRYFSLFSVTDSCEAVTITGTAYPMTKGRLQGNFPLGVSNEITATEATVTVGTGLLLVIRSEKRRP